MKLISVIALASVSLLVCGSARGQDLNKKIIPVIPIKEAVDIAESFLRHNHNNLTRKEMFLSGVDYHETGPWTDPNKESKTSGPYWQVTYERNTHVQGGQIFILVYMDRSIRYVGGI